VKARPERIYALLVEANLVPNPDEANEMVDRHRRHLEVVRPGDPAATIRSVPPPAAPGSRPRRLLTPALTALVAAAAITTAVLVVARHVPKVAVTPEQDAVARVEASFRAVADGRIDDLATIFGAELTTGDRMVWEFTAILVASHPREVRSCEVTSRTGRIIEVECLVHDSDPVFEATGTADYIMPFQSVDGVIRWREFRLAEGIGSPFAAPEAYAEYLELNHLDEFVEACSPASYTGDIVYNGHMVLAPPCAELMVEHSDAVAAWIEAGRPGS
jgi:hypothetical protein